MKHYTITSFGCPEYLCRLGLIPGELELTPAPIRHRRYRIADIQRTVAERFKIPSAEMVSNRRSRIVARPRQIAMYLARELTVSSLPEIGRRFGGRDHTTVMHAIRQIEKLRAIDGDLNADVAALQSSLEAA